MRNNIYENEKEWANLQDLLILLQKIKKILRGYLRLNDNKSSKYRQVSGGIVVP